MTDSSKSALVIDDSATMRQFVVNALQDAGFEVTCATNGFEALKILAQERPFRVIITDVNMPTINGLEIVRNIRNNQSRKDTPIIIMSTDGREKDREKGMTLGANAYLIKPLTPEMLIETVNRFVQSGAAGSSASGAGGAAKEASS